MWNTTNLSTLSTAPADGKINSISWNYTIGSIPANATFTAYLCQDNTSSCINVTSLRSGSTPAFNGRSANGRFFIYHQIYRSTSFAPVSGGSAQVIVNWDNN
ncbi:flagellar protein FlhE [Pseudomonas cichorii]|uniref:flagellar protein FlhE n=1 Tax=Pseudomonas cichorii TaxID=36746 RepID=UPI0035A64C72